MTEPAAPAAPAGPVAHTRTPRWLIALLVVSLALNALVIGMVVRSMWHFRAAAATQAEGLPPLFGGYMRQLPRPRQEAIRGQLQEDRAQLQALRRTLRDARRETADALRADPFDRQAFAAALGRLRLAEGGIREQVQQRFVEVAAGMSLDERRAFVRYLDGHRRGGGRVRGEDGPPQRRRGE